MSPKEAGVSCSFAEDVADVAVSGVQLRTPCRTPSAASDRGLEMLRTPSSATRSRTLSNMTNGSRPRCRTSSDISFSCYGVKPLPKSDVDWLLGSFSEEESSRFHRQYFVNDCRKRFRQLDVDSSGLLDFSKLQDALVEMFPTLKLDLRADGHHIPALDKAIDRLIATFDSDADGCLDFDDFVRFIKFQRAWRAQFFLTQMPIEESSAAGAAESLKVEGSQLGASSKSVGRLRRRNKRSSHSQLPKVATGLLDGISEDANARVSSSSPPSSHASSSTRCSSRASSRSSSRGTLDSSRGAFYSSLMGLSSSLDSLCAEGIGGSRYSKPRRAGSLPA